MTMFARARSTRRFRNQTASFLAESLERRQMLSADLAVSFQEFTVPTPMVPGDRFNAGVFVDNNGPMAAVGLVSINFFLSTDVNFDANDINIGSYPNLPISLSSGDFGDFADEVRIPATTAPGNYFFLVRITPNNQVNDTNQSNNVAASDDFFPVEIKFGNLPGRGNAILEQVDPEGTIVQFQLFNGGTGTISRDDDGRFDISVTGAGANSQLGIATSGGDGIVDIDDITVAGSISSIIGTSAHLRGSLSVSGTLGTLTLGNVGGATAEVPITIGLEGVNTVITLGAVTNASISTPGAIQSLTVTSWSDTTASPADVIEATWIGTLTSTGSFRATLDLSGRDDGPTLGSATLGAVTDWSLSVPGRIGSLSVASWTDTNGSPTDLIEAESLGTLTSAGAFGASIFLSGAASGLTLGSADIGGSLTGGAWRVLGRGGTIEAFTTTARWSASFTQLVTSLTTDRTFRGTLAAKTIQSISIGLDMVGAKILAGANLGSDGRLGGTGDAADAFAAGNINALTVTGKVKNSVVGAGLNPVNGVLNDGDDRIQNPAKSKIGPVTIGSTMASGARIVAGRFTGDVSVNGMLRDPAEDARFQIKDLSGPTAAIVSTDISVVPSLIRIRFTDNVAVLRSSLGDGDIRIDGPDSLFSLSVELVSVSRATNGTPMVATYRFTPPDGTWDPTENGTYTVVLLAGAVTDTAGNVAGDGNAVTVGTFDVAV